MRKNHNHKANKRMKQQTRKSNLNRITESESSKHASEFQSDDFDGMHFQFFMY